MFQCYESKYLFLSVTFEDQVTKSYNFIPVLWYLKQTKNIIKSIVYRLNKFG